MSTTTTLPTLNTDLLLDLLTWAAQDEAHVNDPHFAAWGNWKQGLWAQFTVEGADITGDDVGLVAGVTLSDEEKKELLNGTCQTAFCMAGQAVMQHPEWRLELPNRLERGSNQHADVAVQQRPTGRLTAKGTPIYEVVPDGERKTVRAVARDSIGITEDEALLFFDGDNELDWLRCLANGFCESRGLPLMFPDKEVWHEEQYGGRWGEDDD